jgi:hypothetical protein
MKHAAVALLWAVGVESVLFLGCLLLPGGGHSPLWYTQMVALMVAGKISPAVGSCITCDWGAWIIGAIAQTLVLWLVLFGLLKLTLAPGGKASA